MVCLSTTPQRSGKCVEIRLTAYGGGRGGGTKGLTYIFELLCFCFPNTHNSSEVKFRRKATSLFHQSVGNSGEVRHLNWDFFQGKFGFEGFFQVNENSDTPKSCICRSSYVHFSAALLGIPRCISPTHVLQSTYFRSSQGRAGVQLLSSLKNNKIRSCCIHFPVNSAWKLAFSAFSPAPGQGTGAVAGKNEHDLLF